MPTFSVRGTTRQSTPRTTPEGWRFTGAIIERDSGNFTRVRLGELHEH